MIKHSQKDNLVYIAIAKIDFSYRIPIKKIGNAIDWKIGSKETEGIVIQNVSTWTLQLFTKKTTDEKYIKQFTGIVQEYAPQTTINWADTILAVNIQNEYNWLVRTNNEAQEKITENEIISNLKKKYKLA